MVHNQKVALVCIAKDEDNYIQEWIDYHLNLGFDNVFIFANNWECNAKHQPEVTVVNITGDAPQLKAYNHFIQTVGMEFDYAAFIDVDEFITLRKHKTIQEFLSDYPNEDAIGLNWVLYGDSGLKEVGDTYSVLNRFKMRQKGVNQHIKTILRMRYGAMMPHVHFSNRTTTSPELKRFAGTPFNPDGSDETAYIRHYFCKTYPEWCKKRDRGRADCNLIRADDDFYKHNFNEIEEKL